MSNRIAGFLKKLYPATIVKTVSSYQLSYVSKTNGSLICSRREGSISSIYQKLNSAGLFLPFIHIGFVPHYFIAFNSLLVLHMSDMYYTFILLNIET